MASQLLLVVVCILDLIAFSLVVVAEQRRSSDTLQVSINEAKTTDGASYLELKVPSRSRPRDGIWNFLEKYGFRYGDAYSRALLPSEVMAILRKLSQETKKKLSAKGYFPQDGYIIQYLPVPPNCLSVPDISDGISKMSSDYSITLLKKVLRQVEVIKNSRSGMPNFESQEIEANDLQAAVAQYLQFRGTSKVLLAFWSSSTRCEAVWVLCIALSETNNRSYNRSCFNKINVYKRRVFPSTN